MLVLSRFSKNSRRLYSFIVRSSDFVKTRGDNVLNILDHYKDVENLYLENYENIGFR